MDQLPDQKFFEQLLNNIITWSVETLPVLLLMVIVFVILLRVVRTILRRTKKKIIETVEHGNHGSTAEKEKRATTIINIINGSVMTSMWIIFLMMFLKQLGINIAPILAGAGIVGLAVGWGSQELVRDGISGFFLLFENRIRTGDVVQINGVGGLVEDINLRTTTLRDLSGVVHTFQNGKINTLSNMTKDWSAMVFDIGVAYKENVDHVIALVKQVGEELHLDENFKEMILEPLEIFGLDKFGDSAVVIKARIKTPPSNQWAIGREFNRRLKMAFDANEIEIPFPHRTIYWGDASLPMKINSE